MLTPSITTRTCTLRNTPMTNLKSMLFLHRMIVRQITTLLQISKMVGNILKKVTWSRWTMIQEVDLCHLLDSKMPNSNKRSKLDSMSSFSRLWSRILRRGISTTPFSDHRITPAIKVRTNLERVIHSFWADRKWVWRPAKVVTPLSMLLKEDRIATTSSRNHSANSIPMIMTKKESPRYSTIARNCQIRHLRDSIIKQVSRAKGTKMWISSNSEFSNRCRETSQLIKWKELIK